MNKSQEYLDLIEEIKLIDEDAAKYLETDARKLRYFDEHGELPHVITWRQTPQGEV